MKYTTFVKLVPILSWIVVGIVCIILPFAIPFVLYFIFTEENPNTVDNNTYISQPGNKHD